jgi:tRNA nucleotidyltransferase (CCA-adding enzyme)
MKDALDVVMAWQLRNPKSADANAAIEAVRASREAQTDSELPSRLASHFLQLTIPPFFPQSKANLNSLEVSRQRAPWKEPAAQYVLELLEWSIGALSRKEMEAKWHLLVPPILKMVDDMDAAWKAKGCYILGVLLETLQRPWTIEGSSKHAGNRKSATDFLQRTGYHNVFAEGLLPLFAYIPTLTPEPEAVGLFRELLPTLTRLGLLLPSESSKMSSTRNGFLDQVVREGILSPLASFPTPSNYPELATVMMSQLQIVLGHLGIETVKHLPRLVPLLSAMLQEPFIINHKALTLSTLKALQAVMLNAWPRVHGYVAAIMMGVCLCWHWCMEDEASLGHVGEIKAELQESVAMLDAVMQAADDGSGRAEWKEEKQQLVETSLAYEGLFEMCS